MHSIVDMGDGLVKLKLAKWDHLPFNLKLTEFSEVSLSPSKNLLLLLSSQSEALLLPLTSSIQSSYYFKNDAGTGQCMLPINFTEFPTSIGNVQSFAWGHYGDSVNQFEQSNYKEFLIVCTDNNIIFHSFCYPNKEFFDTILGIESGPFLGKWVEWGPLDSYAEKKCSDIHELKERLDAKSHKSNEQKKWLQTFLMQLDAFWNGSKYVARFPSNSSYPHSAAVLSFAICHNTMKFLESSFSNHSFDETKQDPNIIASKAHCSLLPDNQTSLHYATDSLCSLYKCTRLFTCFSDNHLGIVLTRKEHLTIENELQKGGQLFIVVIKLHHWGLEWVCSVDLEKCNHNPGQVSKWTDFHFLESYLACLSTSGLTYIWCAKTGNPIATIDVLRNCEVSANALPQFNRICENKTFKSLMVFPYSLLLAAADVHGVIYVVNAGDHITGHLSNKVISPFQHSDRAMLASWNTAGKGIGCQDSYSDISNNLCIYALDSLEGSLTSNEHSSDFQPGIMVGSHVIEKKNFNCQNESQGKTLIESTYCKEKLFSTPIRRIHLPPYHQSTEDFICFSPFGVTRLGGYYGAMGEKLYSIFHSNLHISSITVDDRNWNAIRSSYYKDISIGESLGFSFKGMLYVLNQEGIFAILPSISLPCNRISVKRHWQPNILCNKYEMNSILSVKEPDELWRPWQIEVFDRTLLFDGHEEAKVICVLNGWDLEVASLRRMQLGLHYLKFEEIKESLDMLADSNHAEEGILHLLFASVYLLFSKVGNDNEVSFASRLLGLAACFASKMIWKFRSDEHKRGQFHSLCKTSQKFSHLEKESDTSNSQRLSEMAFLLEVIRNIQIRRSLKDKRLFLDKGDERGMKDIVNGDVAMNVPLLPTILSESDSLSIISSTELLSQGVLIQFDEYNDKSVSSMNFYGQENLNDICASGGLENSNATIARWKLDNLDMNTVVKEALLSGRLPLAVLHVHLRDNRDRLYENQGHDNFTDVCDIGRAIAYDLFLKGESALALEMLLRLGEDIEVILRQLLLGTTRRLLRGQIAKEMESYGYMRRHEWKILKRISLIERLYPSSNFWSTYHGRMNSSSDPSAHCEVSKVDMKLHVHENLAIECGDVGGVILGTWATLKNDPSFVASDEENAHVGYWVCAATWADAWDRIIIDRIVLDQPLGIGTVVQWESQLEFHLSRNNFEEVHKLFDQIPQSLLSEKSLKINIHLFRFASENDAKAQGNWVDIYSSKELELDCLFFPNIKVFESPAVYMCSSWLKASVEQRLAKNFIFLKEYWESTAELLPFICRAGLIINAFKSSVDTQLPVKLLHLDGEKNKVQSDHEYAKALQKLVVHYCTQYGLPHFLDLYLEHYHLYLDANALCSVSEAAGNCQWANWLLFLKAKGCEYEASLLNARLNFSKQIAHGRKLDVDGVEERVYTVDDIAEGGGEFAALATLMYESAPLQKLLCPGNVSRHSTSSSQCTLENLKPRLAKFPTLWMALISACFGVDSKYVSASSSSFYGISSLSDYLKCRANMFLSAGGDTSLVQMLPCWFPKSIRRLVRLFTQIPLEWHSLLSSFTCDASIQYHGKYYVSAANFGGISPGSWEEALQKRIQEELYSSLDEDDYGGIEQQLHRGRALAVFNHLLILRASKLKDSTGNKESFRQSNIQTDIKAILSPLSYKEISVLSSVIKLAFIHFDDPVLVTSCTFLLELCGVSTDMFRIDIASLRRISDYYTSIRKDTHNDASSKSYFVIAESHGGDIAYSLARALSDIYIHHDLLAVKRKEVYVNDSKANQRLQLLLVVLQHLEKASLPYLEEGKSVGFWLSSGAGDGFEFRTQQNKESHYWKLVTEFCQIHHLPLSTKYLSLLANDNDWVGFLMEAPMRLFPTDTVIKLASKEFRNPHLRMHVITALQSIPSLNKKQTILNTSLGRNHTNVSISDTMIPTELFELIAMHERLKNPGEALLVKAKDLRWSLMAMIASCFPDVSQLSCLIAWLEITAARETSLVKVDDTFSKVAEDVKAAVEVTNAIPFGCRTSSFHYNRRNPKRKRFLISSLDSSPFEFSEITPVLVVSPTVYEESISNLSETCTIIEQPQVSTDPSETLTSLSKMVSSLCEKRLFLPLIRAFEMFLPSCALLPFVRSLQAFSQMRLSEALAHLASFSTRINDESLYTLKNIQRDGALKPLWISSTARKAAESMLSTCPSAYEKRCLLELLASTDFGDGGSTSMFFQRLLWKINLAEPSLRKDDESYLGNETLDDELLLAALEKNGRWDQARTWARQLEFAGASWKNAAHNVTETQAEAMVAEWKEFLWDVPEERAALWTHCHTLFVRHSLPALQAGLFFLRHSDAAEKKIPARELYEMLLFALQWLSGYVTQNLPVYSPYLLREIETRVWLLAVESEAQSKTEGDCKQLFSIQKFSDGNCIGIIEQTAAIIEKIDGHVNETCLKISERSGASGNCMQINCHNPALDYCYPCGAPCTRIKRRTKNYPALNHSTNMDTNNDFYNSPKSRENLSEVEITRNSFRQEENEKFQSSMLKWQDKVKPSNVEMAILSLLEFGQVTAAKQLQHKLSPAHAPSELAIVDAALVLASLSSFSSISVVDSEVLSFIRSLNIHFNSEVIDPLQLLESLASKCPEGCGRGLCYRIIAVVKTAKALGLEFVEAFEKRPIELLQLLSLKAQDSFEVARIFVETHFMPAAIVARILAESFFKGLLAAHRGGYINSQKEEGPAPLLWRFSDFLKWAELCSYEQEIGHALMRVVMTGQEIPHACEVELLILAHHFYKSSTCLDGVDVLVTLAANRVESYVSSGDFSCLARLVSGVRNFHALNFILKILIENGQLELLLNKYTTPETATGSSESTRGFRMAVITSLKIYNPHDLNSFAIAYAHFGMKHETATLLESRSVQHMHQWLSHGDRDRQTEKLLEAMCFLIEASEVFSTIDVGHKTRHLCARAALLFLQIRMPDLTWIELSETNARRALVEQSRFQVALVVAEAYGLNQPIEWAPVLWNQMLRPDFVEEFFTEFVLMLPLHPSMLLELARFYRSEVAARVDQFHFSLWLSPGSLPTEWVKHMGKFFRSLLKRMRDLRLQVQLATMATGFEDVINGCMKAMDKVPDNAGPLILRRGHGGAYVALM